MDASFFGISPPQKKGELCLTLHTPGCDFNDAIIGTAADLFSRLV